MNPFLRLARRLLPRISTLGDARFHLTIFCSALAHQLVAECTSQAWRLIGTAARTWLHANV